MGPLTGIRVVELAGLGPGPFAAMVLADMGAEVIRIDRPPTGPPQPDRVAALDLLQRSRRSVIVDLKSDQGPGVALRLIEGADALIDPFRPGVTERLGVGPAECLELNPRLVYGRMTGWGQTGPLARTAGHDINYVSLAGPMAAIGRRSSPPAPPLNLVGDFGGGGMLVVLGILGALLERERSGLGQVVDAAMVDGSALLSTMVIGLSEMGDWKPEREANSFDGGSHFYDAYETKDGRFISIGPIEAKFYRELLDRLDLAPEQWPQWDRASWPELSGRMAEIFRSKTRDEWCELLEGSDACFAPVLTFEEARDHPHNRERETYVEAFGTVQPAPAPRFSRTPSRISAPPCLAGEHSREVLGDWGFEADEVDALETAGAIETRARG